MTFVPRSAVVASSGFSLVRRLAQGAILSLLSTFVPLASAQPCPPHWEPGAAPGPNYFVFAATDWDPDGPGPRGVELVLGGGFSIPGVNDVYGLATWDGSAYHGFAGGPGLVRAIAILPNGDLVAAGGFPSINGVPGTSNIARWDRAAGTWNSIGGGIIGSDVEGVAVLPDGRLVAGGQFYQAGGQPIRSLAIWDGVAWAAIPGLDWYPPYSSGDVRISSLAVLSSGDLVVAGFFGLAGGQFVDHIARWNDEGWHPMTGGLVLQPGNGVQCYGVSDMSVMPATSGDQLVVAFNYTQPLTAPLILTSIYAWNGSSWRSLGSPYGLQYFGAAYAISPINDTEIAIGGTLANDSQSEAGRAARWNGSTWSWMGDLNSAAFVLHRRPSGELIAGGAFTTASGIPAPNWARWSTDGAPPVVTQQPLSVSACPSAMVHFSIAAAPTPVSITRWQIESAPAGSNLWSDLTDGQARRDGVLVGSGAGATSHQYTFQRVQGFTDTLRFRAVVSSSCDSIPSSPASFAACTGDFNCDGDVGSQDFFDFLVAFFNNAADFNHDGFTTSQDFFDFLAAFFTGC